MIDPISPETRIEALLRRLTALRLMRPPKNCELSPPMVGILYWVFQSPGSGVQELAEGLQVTPPTISVAVRRLTREGWLERRHNPKDRRAKPLYLTAKSETLLSELRIYHNQVLKAFLSGLTLDEQEHFLQLFERALSAVEESFREDA